MSSVVVVKGEDEKLHGFGQKGERAWRKFRSRVDALVVGETLQFEWHEPRSGPHHRLFFAQLAALFDRQEQFEDMDMLRAWLTVGAGYCDFAPGPRGKMVALPRSIAFHKLDEVEFSELHRGVNDFLRSAHAQRFLWPDIDDKRAAQTIEELLLEFQG
jgi:hypothetical protein